MRKLVGLTLIASAFAAAPAAASPLAVARVTSCTQADRAATFEGDMQALPRSSRLQMRFTLQVRSTQAPRWTRVPAPNFGQWVSSVPGKARYVYDKTVQNLVAGAEYRATVRFRWRRSNGSVLQSVRRYSRSCRIIDPRPDLTAVTIRVKPGSSADTRSYEVVVRNTGHGDAATFALGLTINGAQQPEGTGPAVAAGERVIASFEAPACSPGSVVTAVVDPHDAVEEADETDNEVSIPCPAGTA